MIRRGRPGNLTDVLSYQDDSVPVHPLSCPARASFAVSVVYARTIDRGETGKRRLLICCFSVVSPAGAQPFADRRSFRGTLLPRDSHSHSRACSFNSLARKNRLALPPATLPAVAIVARDVSLASPPPPPPGPSRPERREGGVDQMFDLTRRYVRPPPQPPLVRR